MARTKPGHDEAWLKFSPARIPESAAFVATSMETFRRLMIFQNWI
ncbi:MAG TPA: hypothetical protein VKS24_17900 [Bradyrhizobium sp.]|nr:hypothetical protein [Bradyrhizobium sp.]